MAEIPKYNTPEYEWWLAGATAEAAAFSEGRSEAGLRVRDFVDTLAEHRQHLDEVQIAAITFQIYIADLPLWRRIRLAWKAVLL